MNLCRPTNPSPARPHTTSLRSSAASLPPHGSRCAKAKGTIWPLIVSCGLGYREGASPQIMDSRTDDTGACSCPRTQYTQVHSRPTSLPSLLLLTRSQSEAALRSWYADP